MHAVKDQSCVQHSGNGIGKCPLTCAIFNIFLSIIAALLHLNVHLAPRRAKIVEGDAKATGVITPNSGLTTTQYLELIFLKECFDVGNRPEREELQSLMSFISQCPL